MVKYFINRAQDQNSIQKIQKQNNTNNLRNPTGITPSKLLKTFNSNQETVALGFIDNTNLII